MHGAGTETGRPSALDLNSIAGEVAGADWTAAHPHAAAIRRLRHDALASEHVAGLAAAGNDPTQFATAFWDWTVTEIATTLSASAFARACLADPSFAADVTATLAEQVYELLRDPEPRAADAAAEVFRAEASRRAAAAARAAIGEAELVLRALAGGRDADLNDAVSIDMHLARAGIPATSRTVTWDDAAGCYAIDLDGEEETRFRLAIPAPGAAYTIRPGDAPAITLSRIRGQAADETAGVLLTHAGLAGKEPAQPPKPPDYMEELACRHGMHVTRDSGETIIRDPENRPVLRSRDGQLENRPGRVIPASLADAYVAAAAAAPQDHPDVLYARIVAGAPADDGTGDGMPDERAVPSGNWFQARDAAAGRASRAAGTCYVYADGHAYVTASDPPPAAAYLSVTFDGQWASRIDGTTAYLDQLPGTNDFSAISGKQAAPRATQQDLQAGQEQEAPSQQEASATPATAGPLPGSRRSASAGYQSARANALEVLGGSTAGQLPDAEQFADFYARTYGHKDPGKWPLVMQVYAEEWLPDQPASHPLKLQAQPGGISRAGTGPDATPGGPAAADHAPGPAADATTADWAAAHPFAADISQLREGARADRDVGLWASANDPDHFVLVFWDRLDSLVGDAAIEAGSETDFAVAFWTDPSFAADVTATLAEQVYQELCGPERHAQAAATDVFAAEACRRAAKAHKAAIGAAARGGPAEGRDDDLHDAVAIDTHLARAGIPAARRGITWDGDAGCYAIDLTGDDGRRLRLAIPPAGGEYTFRDDVADGMLPARRSSTPPAETARLLLSFSGQSLTLPAGGQPGPPGAAEPAAAAAEDPLAPWQELAGPHGLTAVYDEEYPGGILIRHPDDPPGRFALCQPAPGDYIFNQNGRPVPVPRMAAYLAAYAVNRSASPDQIYAEIAPTAAGERSFPGKDRLTARDTARDQAAQTAGDWYVYAHGQALVCTSREPASGPYFTVTPAGHWSAHGGAPLLPSDRPPEQAKFISLASQTPDRHENLPATDPAAAATDGREPPDGSLASLAAVHGMHARVNSNTGTTVVYRSEIRAGQPVLRQDYPGGPLLNQPGRVIPEEHAAAYLAAAARSAALSADDLYQQVIPGAGAGEEAWPRPHCHVTYSTAAIRAREAARPWVVYADGQAAVAAPDPPASGAAYYRVTPHGQDVQWTRHLHGETQPVTHHLRPQDLSLIARETAAAPGQPDPAAPEQPPAQAFPGQHAPGPAAAGSTPAGQPAADWTITHPHAAAIARLREIYLASDELRRAIRDMSPDQFSEDLIEAFTQWAGTKRTGDDDAAALARQYLSDPSFAADLTVTLARQVHHALGGRDAETIPAGEVHPHAVRDAAFTWQTRIRQARATECGCRTGCASCDLPEDSNRDLLLATETDIHLARAGVPPDGRVITWDPGPGTYVVAVTTPGSLGWRIVPPDGDRPFTATCDDGRELSLLSGSPREAARDFLASRARDTLEMLAGRHGMQVIRDDEDDIIIAAPDGRPVSADPERGTGEPAGPPHSPVLRSRLCRRNRGRPRSPPGRPLRPDRFRRAGRRRHRRRAAGRAVLPVGPVSPCPRRRRRPGKPRWHHPLRVGRRPCLRRRQPPSAGRRLAVGRRRGGMGVPHRRSYRALQPGRPDRTTSAQSPGN